MDKKSKFEQFKKTLDFKKSKLSESIGKLDSLKQQAKEEFGTDSIEKLKKMQEKYEQEKENVESQIRELESTITTILNEMDEDDE